MACVVWQLERPSNCSVATLGDKDFDLIGPFGPLALLRDRQPTFLNAWSRDSLLSPGMSK
jgi:hypothetical protein